MSGLLEELCVLQSIDQLKLFTLHSLHIRLVSLLLFSFALQLFLNLLPSALLSLKHVELTLLGCLLFLIRDHDSHLLGTLRLLVSHFLIALLRCLLLSFGVQGHCLLSLSRGHLRVLHLIIRRFFHSAVHLAFHLLLHHLLPHAFLFRLLVHNVSLTLRDDLVRPFASLIDFFDNL